MTENNVVTQKQEEQILKTVEQVLAAAKKSSVAYASGIWVPSLKREVKFNELNTAQQKKLIKSIIDSPVFNTEFIGTFHDIVKENCVEPDVDINKLTVLDKLMIALGTRISSIGNEMQVEVDTKSGKKVTVTIDLKKVYEIAKETTKSLESRVFTDEIYYVQCSTPSIEMEYQIEKELRETSANTNIETSDQLRATIGDAFVSEIAKFISGVTIKGESGEVLINWQGFSFKDRIKIIESFSTKLLKQILAYVSEVRTELDKIEIINFEVEGEVFTRRLSIDGSFFMIS